MNWVHHLVSVPEKRNATVTVTAAAHQATLRHPHDNRGGASFISMEREQANDPTWRPHVEPELSLASN